MTQFGSPNSAPTDDSVLGAIADKIDNDFDSDDYVDLNGNGFPDYVDENNNNQYDLGTSSNRWQNIYTNDLNLSNEGSKNDVDGTWGNYTIQEGESDLFLINNRSGKKYKFNLTEVS